MRLEELTNLQQRVVSAIVMAAAVLALTVIGGIAFRAMAVLIAVAVFFEWAAMTPGGLSRGWRNIGALFAAAMLFVVFAAHPLVCLLAGLVAGSAAALVAETRGKGAWLATGFAYAFLIAFVLSEVRGDSLSGLVAVLFLFAVVWATDICAYFVGRAMGGPRLAPSISPGKTWSGAIGGAAGGMVAGLALAAMFGHLSPAVGLVALALSAVAQLGDLFESGIKRKAGVKDSSHLIPGHGGVMDRVDGLAVAAMALYLIGLAGGNMDRPAHSLF